ncbi:hypothetical protein [Halorubrum tebenquichense]|uniref:Uncharacterized protein n=1 Tax=Halorubrum tebenquichense DSM 14210 TaxID=1227485 RepID=M0DJG3_9EURY|nr:hypothetical protein [Halorubrum tebenquichense]ELZ35631.1 hypothetical protein C472_11409 [Halorubrum tebenquichense DSM 14210]
MEPLVRSAGFDEVAVDGETVRVANDVGPASIELTLELVGDLLDAAMIERQRRAERSAQFDWLEGRCESDGRGEGST